MIAGIFHEGSGLGNQLFRYVATRVRAADKGTPTDFAMINPHLFKGASFMDIDMGWKFGWGGNNEPTFIEKRVVENGVDIRGYDPEFNFIQYGVIDGEFQDPKYFEHRLNEMREWLFVQPLKMNENLCVIGFRGGEYKLFPDLFLPKEYWTKAIAEIQSIGGEPVRFEVHTDDPLLAKEFFPDFPIINDIELNWRSVRYANYLILANSSFYILPALLNQNVKKIIAPRYWARHNTKIWALPQNYYKQFTYL